MVKKRLVIAGKFLVALAMLIMAREYFSREVFERIFSSPWLFLGFAVMCIFNQLIMTWRLDLLLGAVKCSVPFLALSRAGFISMLFSSFLPGLVGADLAKIVLVKSSHPEASVKLVGSGVFLDRVVGLGTLILLSMCASLWLPLSEYNTEQIRFVGFMWLLGAAALLSWLAFLFGSKYSKGRFLPLKNAGLRSPLARLRRLVSFSKVWALPLLTQLKVLTVSMLGISSVVAAQTFICLALLDDATRAALPAHPLALLVFLFPTLTIIQALPITPLGVGVSQLAVSKLFPLFGLPAEVGVAVTTLGQLAQALVAIGLGGSLFWFRNDKGAKLKNVHLSLSAQE